MRRLPIVIQIDIKSYQSQRGRCKHMLDLIDLTKTYGQVKALDRMTFSVQPGAVFGFLGPNGSGKTTAMRSIFGLISLEAGHVQWKNAPITPDEIRQFGYMPEERGLYPKMSVMDHLVYLGRLHSLSTETATKRAQALIDELEVKGGGSAKVESLSLGNKQRTQIAAALIHEPTLLVMDEPFSGLDPISIEVVRGIFKKYAQEGKTVLFSSHQLEVVEDLCESVAIAYQGRIVAWDRLTTLTELDKDLIIKVQDDLDGNYLNQIDDISILDNHEGTFRLRLARPELAPVVLHRAMEFGTLERYEVARRRLSDVFKEAISTSGLSNSEWETRGDFDEDLKFKAEHQTELGHDLKDEIS